MNRGTRRSHTLFLTLALFGLAALIALLTACTPCPDIYAVACATH